MGVQRGDCVVLVGVGEVTVWCEWEYREVTVWGEWE